MGKQPFNFVSVNGFGYSGSGALIDLFKEFNSYYVFEKEFRLIKDPDGIIDLENALVNDWQELTSDIALRRFINLVNVTGRKQKVFSAYGYNLDEEFNNQYFICCKRYIENLTDIEWNGNWQYHFHDFSRFKYFIYRIKRRLKLNPDLGDKMYFSKPNGNFNEMTRLFLDQLFSNVIDLNKFNTIVLNQVLPPYDPEKYLKYFNNIKVLVVDRDPRDIYMELCGRSAYPTDSIQDFIKYFKAQRNSVKNYISSNKILRISFEDLVLNYQSILAKIYSFLDLDIDVHAYKKTFFNPHDSMKNIGKWKTMKNNKNIEIIEEKLKDYLYSD